MTPASKKKSNAGRKPIDVIVMFRMLVLQSLYNLSDEQIEYQVRDRLSFTRFLRLGIEDSIPDGTTLWLFRETLAKTGLIEKLFERFGQHLEARGFVVSCIVARGVRFFALAWVLSSYGEANATLSKGVWACWQARRLQ